MPLGLRFRNQLFGYNVDHRSGSKRKCIGKNRLHGDNGRRTDHPGDGFNDPGSLAVQKTLSATLPFRRKGTETAAPSGKFWIPMPMASAIAAPIEAAGCPAAAAPKATPTASPSGILCKVIARTRSTERCEPVLIPSASFAGKPG